MSKRTCYLFTFLSVFLLLIVSCQKDVPVNLIIEPKDSVAVFSLLSSDSACYPPVINGNFLEGKELTSNEYIQVEVNVSKAGKWIFATDTLNGFLFATGGMFTDTGKQVIKLNAFGTPSAAGNYFFSLTTGSLKRFFPISVLKNDVLIESVSLKSYFKANIGGVNYYTEAPTIGPDNIPYGGGGADTTFFSSYVSPGIFPNPPGTGTLTLQKGLMYHFLTSSEADFKRFFQPGFYPFAANRCNFYMYAGLTIFWSTSEGTWSTLKTFADQKGSSFAITGIEDGHDSKGHYYVKVTSRFNCKLYKLGGNEVTELKEGEAVSFFIRP
jgi:hypothetical protein